GIKYNFSLATHYIKQTKYNGYIVMIAAVINIFLNFILIPIFNIYGAAIASILSMLFMIFSFYKISQRLYFIPFEISKLFKLVTIATTLFLLSFSFFDFGIVMRIFLKFCLIVIYPFILYFVGFYEKVELQRIKNFFKKWSRKIIGIKF
ncbi:MAG: polysaccharide biosynthesis C-terminal domain-containing protein, partial [Candidatus Cloacimonadota bacterium]|nr:polysaccharide biosynthesis C-terminal domain-containing protein [Candidatus Cloacimonadota bacterium]